MRLSALLKLVEILIEKYGPDSSVAVFIYTVEDVFDATNSSSRSNSLDANEVLNEFMHNWGEPPLEDYLLEQLEELVREMESDEDRSQ